MARTILIVDDDPDCVHLLSLMLQRGGFHVCSAMNGQEAMEIVQNEKVDLISLDVVLPDINGLELCQHLRRCENYSSKPIIILSARASEKDLHAGLAAGADAYLNKATQITEWVAAVSELIANQATGAPVNLI